MSRVCASPSTAEAGIAVFRNAFERWVDDKELRPLSGHIRASLKELRAVTAVIGASSSRRRTTNTSRLVTSGRNRRARKDRRAR
jgi:hypothetical protein